VLSALSIVKGFVPSIAHLKLDFLLTASLTANENSYTALSHVLYISGRELGFQADWHSATCRFENQLWWPT